MGSDFDDFVGEEAIGRQICFDVHVEFTKSFGEVRESFASSGLECYAPVFSGKDVGNILELSEEEAFQSVSIRANCTRALAVRFVLIFPFRSTDRCYG